MFQDTATESDCCSAIDDTQFSKLVSLKGATMAAAEAFGSDQPELAIEKICLDQTGDCEKGLFGSKMDHCILLYFVKNCTTCAF